MKLKTMPYPWNNYALDIENRKVYSLPRVHKLEILGKIAQKKAGGKYVKEKPGGYYYLVGKNSERKSKRFDDWLAVLKNESAD